MRRMVQVIQPDLGFAGIQNTYGDIFAYNSRACSYPEIKVKALPAGSVQIVYSKYAVLGKPALGNIQVGYDFYP